MLSVLLQNLSLSEHSANYNNGRRFQAPATASKTRNYSPAESKIGLDRSDIRARDLEDLIADFPCKDVDGSTCVVIVRV